MLTTMTHVTLEDGKEPEWDQAMAERLEAARARPGWVHGQVLIPLDRPNDRVILGTWSTRADWEAWHEDETFKATRQRIDGLEAAPRQQSWHEVTMSSER